MEVHSATTVSDSFFFPAAVMVCVCVALMNGLLIGEELGQDGTVV